MSEKIKTLHPQGKRGVNIDKAKYDAVRDAILNILDERDVIAFADLPDAVSARLIDFEGSVSWYTISVKLDLEARGAIERLPTISPQQIRRKA